MSKDMGVGTADYERESKDNIEIPLMRSDFVVWLQNTYKSKSENTQMKLEHMIHFIEGVLKIEDFSQLRYTHTIKVKNWIVNQSGWKNSTQVRRMLWLKTIIKAYEEYCLIENKQYPLKFTSGQIKGIKENQNDIVPVLQEKEMLGIFNAIEKDKKGSLINASLKIIYFGALRRSEALNLKREHIIENRNTINIVDGKGGKSASIVVEEEAINAVLDYYNKYRIYPKEEYDDYVFISLYKRKIEGTAIKRRLKQLAVKVGIPKRVFPHLLRASNATHRILQGWNPWEVKEYLRHSKFKDTEKYVRTASLLAQGNVEIGLIKLREPTFKSSYSNQNNGNNGNGTYLKFHDRYLTLFEEGKIDLETFKSLNENIQKCTGQAEKLMGHNKNAPVGI